MSKITDYNNRTRRPVISEPEYPITECVKLKFCFQFQNDPPSQTLQMQRGRHTAIQFYNLSRAPEES